MTADDTDDPADEPDVPDSIPTYLVDGVSKQDTETLRDLVAYATAMADWQETEAQRELESTAERH